MNCSTCGVEESDLRFGVCFDCASRGEETAARRTVMQHVTRGVWNIRRGCWFFAKYDFLWAWERLTKTGDYAKGGEFSRYMEEGE